MSSIAHFLSGRKILEELDSPINGKLTVVRDLAWGTHVLGGGVTQSGGVVEKVWQTSLDEVKNINNSLNQSLILGLGGGTIAKLLKGNWPETRIVGVDIDPIMIDIGKRYLNLDELGVESFVDDGFDFVVNQANEEKVYDLICVDIYVQSDIPKRFEEDYFLNKLRKIRNKNGIIVFNRLYYCDKRKSAMNFEKKLLTLFDTVDRVYPEANVMFVCR